MLKETPFHPRTSALMEGYAWRRWAGYTAASVYELTHEREYHAVRRELPMQINPQIALSTSKRVLAMIT